MQIIQLMNEYLIDFYTFFPGVEILENFIDIPLVSTFLLFYLTIKYIAMIQNGLL